MSEVCERGVSDYVCGYVVWFECMCVRVHARENGGSDKESVLDERVRMKESV